MWKIVTIIVIVVLLTGLFSGCREEKGQASRAALPEYAVEAVSLKKGKATEYREWIGRLEGLVSAEVMPQVSGYIAERLFDNGQQVKAGDVLYRIDPLRYEQELERAQQQQQEALANYEDAKQTSEYYRPLVGNGAISRQTYTDAVQREQAASAALAAARTGVDLARTNVGYCTLTSPVDGVMGFARADVGSYVSPSGAPLVQVSRMDPIRVYFSISEQDWLNQGGAEGSLRPGASVELLLPNGERYPDAAIVDGVDNAVSTATGSLQLEAHVSNPGNMLRPGMFVRVRARVAEIDNALLAPIGAIVSIQGKTMVVVVNERDEATLVPVTTGLQQDGMVAIQGAVSPGDWIISSGTQQGMMAAEKRALLHVKREGKPL